MNYRKLDKKMRKHKIEYTVEDKSFTIKIQVEPSKNDEALKIIESSLGKREACINNAPGKFSIIQTFVKVYKIPAELLGY